MRCPSIVLVLLALGVALLCACAGNPSPGDWPRSDQGECPPFSAADAKGRCVLASCPKDGEDACRQQALACARDAKSEGCWQLGLALEREADEAEVREVGARKLSRARELFERGCRKEQPEGCAELSRFYTQGRGVAKDKKRARTLLDRGCELGSLRACRRLWKLYALGRDEPEFGLILLYMRGCEDERAVPCLYLAKASWRGSGVPQDRARALKLAKTSCELGEQYACHQLGLWYLDETPLRDLELGEEYLERSCEAGRLYACASLALALDDGGRLSEDKQRAHRLYLRTCRGGLIDACFLVGRAYLGGQGVEKDHDEALKWLQYACTKESGEACLLLGSLAAKESEELQRARKFYRQACGYGTGDGCHALGRLYEQGEGTPVDYARAVKLYEESCRKKSAKGCTELGTMYEAALGVKVDLGKAAALYEKGCEGGHRKGCLFLGRMLRDGNGQKKNLSRARELIKRACARTVPEACQEYGWFFETGEGGEKSLVEAARFYYTSCEYKYAFGCLQLGRLAEHNNRDPKMIARALEFYRRACKMGEDDGCLAAARFYMRGRDGSKGILTWMKNAAAELEIHCRAKRWSLCKELGVLYGFVPEVGTPRKTAEVLTLACANKVLDGCAVLALYYKNRAVGRDEDALSLATAACKGGSAQGCMVQAELMIEGRGTVQAVDEGRALLKKACAATDDPNHTLACMSLADRHRMGLGLARRPAIAAGLYKKLCVDEDFPTKFAACGAWLSLKAKTASREERQDFQARLKPMRVAFEKLCEEEPRLMGCIYLGDLYGYGLGVPENKKRARSYYKDLCDIDDRSACQRLELLKRKKAKK